MDVWGGPDAPISCHQARVVRPIDEALEFARLEVEQGFVVWMTVAARPDVWTEFDNRVQGRA